MLTHLTRFLSARAIPLLLIATAGLQLAFPSENASAQVVTTLPAEPVVDWHDPSFWETVDGQSPEQSWAFSDSEVRLEKPRGGRNSLISGPLPSSFDLSWQWKIEPGANTGLKYRLRQFGNRWLGVEYQIIDDGSKTNSQSSASKTDKGSTASIYDLVAPNPDVVTRPPGQWNDARVVARGSHLQHYLNGELVAEITTAGPQWELAFALSKFYGADRFALPTEGDRIMLTDHGGKASYRNFRFVALDEPASQDAAAGPADDRKQADGAVSQQGPFLGNAFRNSWADQDSIVLWTRTTASSEMRIDGTPFITLSTAEANQLARLRDPEPIHQAQLPPGATLDEMLGACPAAPGEVRLTYFPERQRKQSQTTPWQATDPDRDHTHQWQLKDLRPGTSYAAIVEARDPDSKQLTAVVRGGFRTAPAVDQAAEFNFCVTTCHDFIRRDDGWNGHQIYSHMPTLDPDFVVHAGDIEYYDKPDPWAMTIPLMRFKWGRIFSLPRNREFYSNTSSFFIKDDHDTLKNDCWPGQRYGAVTFDQGVELFNQEQFPTRSPRYATVRWGRDVQIWFLEGRDYRSPNNMPDGPQKTILGEKQKAWLFETLKQSDATFKLIFSPTPVVGPDRTNKKDNHANDVFAHEGQQLREQLSKHDGVIVFCGDRHWQYASVDEQTGVWEFGCGPGSAEHQLGWKQGDERPSHRFLRVAGGYLSGHLTLDEQTQQPKLTIRHRKVDGEPVSKFEF